MNLHRGNGDMLRWITKFQLSTLCQQDAGIVERHLPSDHGSRQCRSQSLHHLAPEQATITMQKANELTSTPGPSR